MTLSEVPITKEEFLSCVLSCGTGRCWSDEDEVLKDLTSRLSYAMYYIGVQDKTQTLVFERLNHENDSWAKIARILSRDKNSIKVSYQMAMIKLVRFEVVYEILNRGVSGFDEMLKGYGKDCPLAYVRECYIKWSGWRKILNRKGILTLRDLEKFSYKELSTFSNGMEGFIRILALKYDLSIREV